LDLTKERLGELKMPLECNTNDQEPATIEGGGGDPFIQFLKKLVIETVRAYRSNQSTIPVRPVG
jgi:predicted alpha/beta superfamily hydrolase